MVARTLILMRHAEASDGPVDFDRPLTARGQAQAAALGEALRQAGLVPDLVLSSSARRARETAEGVLRAAGWAMQLRLEEGLYNATAAAMAALVHAQAARARCVMLVAHAPGVPDFASMLCTRHHDLRLQCPPATCIQLEADVSDWALLEPGQAQLARVLSG